MDEIQKMLAPYRMLAPVLRGDPLKQLGDALKKANTEAEFEERLDVSRAAGKEYGMGLGLAAGFKEAYESGYVSGHKHGWKAGAGAHTGYSHRRGFLEGMQMGFLSENLRLVDKTNMDVAHMISHNAYADLEKAVKGTPAVEHFGGGFWKDVKIKTQDIGVVYDGTWTMYDRNVMRKQQTAEGGQIRVHKIVKSPEGKATTATAEQISAKAALALSVLDIPEPVYAKARPPETAAARAHEVYLASRPPSLVTPTVEQVPSPLPRRSRASRSPSPSGEKAKDKPAKSKPLGAPTEKKAGAGRAVRSGGRSSSTTPTGSPISRRGK